MANGEELALSCQMPPAAGASLVTLKLSGEALGALQAYLRSGAARGLPFEQPLREGISLTLFQGEPLDVEAAADQGLDLFIAEINVT